MFHKITLIEKRVFFLVFGVKVLLLFSFLFFFGEANLIWSDSTNYIDLGRNILKGNGFSTASGLDGSIILPDSRRMPLYPLLIGFFDAYFPHGLVIVSFLQTIAAALTALFMYRIGSLFLSSAYAIAASLIFSLEPLIAVMQILIMPETFFVLFVSIFLWQFLEYLREGDNQAFFGSLVALTLACYTKPIAIWLFVVPASFIFFSRRGFLKAFAFGGILLFLLSPWMVRNYWTHGILRITTNDLGNFCGWELGGIIATKYGMDSSDFTSIYALPEYIEQQERCTSTNAALKIFLLDYPGAFLKASALSTLSFLTNEGYPAFFERPPEEQVKIHHNYLTPAVFANSDWPSKIIAAARELTGIELAAVLVGKFFWLFISLLALLSIMRLVLKEKSSEAFFLAAVIGYFIAVTVVSTGYGVGARLRYPIDLLLIIFAMQSAWFFIHRFIVIHR